jgi:hypothetical protein
MNKRLLLMQVLRALGLQNLGSLDNLSRADLVVVLAALRRLQEKQASDLGEGAAAKEGLKLSDIPPKKLEEGAKIEAEHTPDKPTQRRIAADHIAELGEKYYPELKKMEKRLKEAAFVQGYLGKAAAVDAEYSSTAKPDRERVRRRNADANDAMEAAQPAASEVGPDNARPGDSEHRPQAAGAPEASRVRDLPWIKTRAQELDASNGNMGTALCNMLTPKKGAKQELPFRTNMEPGAAEARSRRVEGSGVES